MLLTHGVDRSPGCLGAPAHVVKAASYLAQSYLLLLLRAREEGFSHLGTYVSELVLFDAAFGGRRQRSGIPGVKGTAEITNVLAASSTSPFPKLTTQNCFIPTTQLLEFELFQENSNEPGFNASSLGYQLLCCCKHILKTPGDGERSITSHPHGVVTTTA